MTVISPDHLNPLLISVRPCLFVALIIGATSCDRKNEDSSKATQNYRQEARTPRLIEGKSSFCGVMDLRKPENWTDKNGVPTKTESANVISLLNDMGEEKWDCDGETGGYLQSMCFWCRPEDFEQALGILAKSKGEASTKYQLLSHLVNRMIREGGPQSLSRVLSGIQKVLGTGRFSEQARDLTFEHAGFSKEMFLELRKIENEGERTKIMRGMSMSLKYAKDLSSIADIDLTELTSDERSSLYDALATRLANAKNLDGSFSDIVSETIRLAGTRQETVDLLTKCSKNAPFEMWNMITGYATKIGEDGIESVRRTCIAAMARQNGSLALGKALELQTGASRVELLQAGMTAYIATNSAGAADWLKKNGSHLTPIESDSIETAFIQSSLGIGDLEAAKLMLQQIGDPVLLDKAKGFVWTAERDTLHKEAGKDPARTLESIVSGQSKYADYWLEEAMETWMAKDFDKAQGWYQENWKTLPANKAQYVAAAFAKQAASQGDTATARQWSAYIQDAKTKQRIDEGIAKAEAGK